MRSRVRLLAVCMAVGVWTWALGTGAARAQIAWAPCGSSNEYACGHLTVPLDPSGARPGTITLAMRRHRAPVGEAREAIVALAGGPGQAALGFTEDFTQLLGPIAATRDLIVFDQRGIGLSHPLSCHRFELGAGGRAGEPAGRQISECAAQLGPERSYYTTAQTVADLEAIRRAGGYERLVLYGTSYGTKVAERYAQTYPSHVSALVLDSVVPPNGPEPLNLPTFGAIPRVLHQLCAARACARITPEPVADLGRLVRRMRGRSLGGRWIDGRGHAHALRFSADTLLDVLIAGDLQPDLRAEFPAAVRSAARGDDAPFARLLRHAQEEGEDAEGEPPSESFDTPLYYATSCEEELFPWSRASTPANRLAEARARIRTLPAGLIAPFDPSNVLALSDMPECAFWPYATPAPPPVQTAPFPSVPTLILSGAQDLRTPTSNAREVALQIPGSHVLVVPRVGHSVLGSDLSGCARKALQALFAPAPIRPCGGGRQILGPFKLTPLAPTRLSQVPAARHTRGRFGRTLTAVALTLADFVRQEVARVLGAIESGDLRALGGLRVGGLRAGWAGARPPALVLRGYSYVPGVTVSGRLSGARRRAAHRRPRRRAGNAAHDRLPPHADGRPRREERALVPEPIAGGEPLRERRYCQNRCAGRPHVRFWRRCCPRSRSRSGPPARARPLAPLCAPAPARPALPPGSAARR